MRYMLMLIGGALATFSASVAGDPPKMAPTTNKALKLIAQNTVDYRGQKILTLTALVDNPAAPNASPGLIVYYIPPVDIPRDDKGRPQLKLVDPLGARGINVQVNGETRRVETDEFVKLVREGAIKADLPVEVSLPVRLHESDALKKHIAKTFEDQVHSSLVSVDDPKKTSRFVASASATVMPLPPESLRLFATDEGMEFKAPLEGSANGSNVLRFTGKTNAAFVARACGDVGVNMAVAFSFTSYRMEITAVKVDQSVTAIFDALLEGKGNGHTAIKVNEKESDFSLLCTKTSVDRVLERLRGRLDVAGRIGNADDFALLVGLFQRQLKDPAGDAADQLQDALEKTYALRDLVNKPGITEAIAAVKNKKELTEKEFENLHEKFRQESSGKSSSGGFSFLGIGGGGGSSSYNQLTDAEKKYYREMTRNFIDDLTSYSTSGKWPTHPNVEFRLLTKRDIANRFEQDLKLARAGQASADMLLSRFNTAHRTLLATEEELQRHLRR